MIAMIADGVTAFNQNVARIQASPDYRKPEAFGLAAVRRVSKTGEVLDVRFPTVNLKEDYGSHAVFWEALNGGSVDASRTDSVLDELLDVFSPFLGYEGGSHPNIDAVSLLQTLFRVTADDVDPEISLTLQLIEAPDISSPPTSAEEAWLRLHLLSHLLVKPNEQNLDGLFGLLTNVAWTNDGPYLPDWLNELLIVQPDLLVYGIDKFPRMTDYVPPANGVRIAHADRVRLGAYLSPGTTVMHEGFVNFNAGTLGASMVEGRISQGVVVGADSDIGGGASIHGHVVGRWHTPRLDRSAKSSRCKRGYRNLDRR